MRLINPNFAKLLYGLIVSSTGNFIFDTTLVLWIGARLLEQRSYAPAAVSGVLIAVSIGAFAIGPIAGVFVDRWDRRRTMMGSDLIRGGLNCVLVVVALLPAGTLPIGVILGVIYAVVLSSTAVAQFFGPARFALIGAIVPDDDDRARAASMTQTAGYVAAIVGPPLAAPLLFTVGVVWALVFNAASFFVSYVLIRSIRVPETIPAVVGPVAAIDVVVGEEAQVEQVTDELKPRFRDELLVGIQFVWRTPVMRAMLIAIVIFVLGTGALNALDVFFVIGNLHTDPHWYGVLGMVEGIGAIVGTLFAAWLCRRFTDTRVFAGGLTIVGIGLIGYSRLDALWMALVVLGALALPLGALNVASGPITLRTVPADMLGRAMSVFGPLQQVAGMVSALVAGWLVSTVLRNFDHTVAGVHFGRIDTVFVACGLLMVIGGLYAAVVMWSPPRSTDHGAESDRSDAAISPARSA
jgi:MFS family permease